MRAPLGVGLRMNWLFVVKKRRAAGSRPMIVVPWSANTKLAPNLSAVSELAPIAWDVLSRGQDYRHQPLPMPAA